MRFKNFTLFFLMGIFGLFTTNLFAQQDATIDPADIRYWIGEGENEVVFIVNWNEPDTALAWGYRFNSENVTVKDMMLDIQSADHRFGFDGDSFVNDITFNDGFLNLQLTSGGYFMYNVDGVMAQVGFDQQVVRNGNYVKWGDTNCGTDPEGTWNYVWEKEVVAVYPIANEAKIDFAEILYWIGQGENEMVFCVNWNNPNKALAWGYRFDGESIVLKDVMDAIAEADERFAYDASAGYVSDLTFDDDDLHLSLYGMYFMYNINGVAAWYGYDQQTIVSGDFVKWGDESCGTEIAPWTYVWTQEVEPVSVYLGMGDNLVSNLSVYPNPAVNETFVTIGNAGVNEISVYDMQGRLVGTQSVNAASGEQVRLGVESMNAGVYFVRVRSGNATQTTKLVVK